MDCRNCVWYARAHYNGTPADEVYEECEYHWKVLQEDELAEGCDHFEAAEPP